MNNLSDLKNSLHSFEYSQELQTDWESISVNKDLIIAGFLSIGKKDGWNQEEGGPHQLGFRFTRYMFGRFCLENADRLNEYNDILKNAFSAFSPEGQKSDNLHPRTQIDGMVKGWYKHSVARIVGSIGSKQTQNGPFFEILINSARTSENKFCFPFKVLIFANKDEAIARSKCLSKLDQINSSLAYPQYYQTSHDSPEEFQIRYQKEHNKAPGPNALRILEGLKFLTLRKMKAQTVGNCWMKQNKRQVLITLFIETLTLRPEFSVNQAWTISLKLYKKWTQYTKEDIEKMVLDKKGICLDLARIAEQKLENKCRH